MDLYFKVGSALLVHYTFIRAQKLLLSSLCTFLKGYATSPECLLKKVLICSLTLLPHRLKLLFMKTGMEEMEDKSYQR